MEKKKTKPGVTQESRSIKAPTNPDNPMQLELKKTPVNLNQGCSPDDYSSLALFEAFSPVHWYFDRDGRRKSAFVRW